MNTSLPGVISQVNQELNGNMQVKIASQSAHGWLMLMGLAAAPALLPAQVSLATVVDLAQQQLERRQLAEADVQKAHAVLAQTHDVYVPSLAFGSDCPAYPIGFTGGIPSIAEFTVQSLVFSFPQTQYIGAARAG